MATAWTEMSRFLNGRLKQQGGRRTVWSWVGLIAFASVAVLLAAMTARWTVSPGIWVLRAVVTAAGLFALGYLGYKDLRGAEQTATGVDDRPIDRWSLVHFGAGVVLGTFLIPFSLLLLLTVSWEAFEVFVPGFGDNEINANRIMDIVLAWIGWVLFAGAVAAALHTQMPWLV